MVGKTETGKLYHIVNVMNGGGNFSLCGCYMPEKLREDGLDAFKLEDQGLICEKCMHSRYYKQERD